MFETRVLATETERLEEERGERFLSWHTAGERLPLDRTVRDYVYHHSNSIGGSTARRYSQFGERLIARLGRLDLRDLREEDIAASVLAEFKDGRAKDLTINACVLLRSVMRAALAARDAYRRAHLAEDPLPRIAEIARRTVRKLWAPARPFTYAEPPSRMRVIEPRIPSRRFHGTGSHQSTWMERLLRHSVAELLFARRLRAQCGRPVLHGTDWPANDPEAPVGPSFTFGAISPKWLSADGRSGVLVFFQPDAWNSVAFTLPEPGAGSGLPLGAAMLVRLARGRRDTRVPL